MTQNAKDTVMTIGKLLDAPCIFCGYNGTGYWQVTTHSKECPFHGLGGGRERENALRDILISREAQAEISFKAGEAKGQSGCQARVNEVFRKIEGKMYNREPGMIMREDWEDIKKEEGINE